MWLLPRAARELPAGVVAACGVMVMRAHRQTGNRALVRARHDVARRWPSDWKGCVRASEEAPPLARHSPAERLPRGNVYAGGARSAKPSVGRSARMDGFVGGAVTEHGFRRGSRGLLGVDGEG